MPAGFDNSARASLSYQRNGGTNFQYSLPSQTVSWNEKMGNGKEVTDWQQHCMGYFAGAFLSGSSRRNQKRINYKLINGEFDFKDYKNSLRPIYAEEDYGEIPVEMKHYPICTLPLKELWGTEPTRPFNWRAKDQSEGATNEYLRAKSDMLQQYIQGKIGEEFKRKGIDISTPEGQQMIPKDIEDYFKRKYNTATEIAANKILRKLLIELDVKEKFQLGWKDATVVAEEWYWVGTLNNKVAFRVVNPMNIIFDKSYDIKYLDEAEWVVWGEYMSPSQIIDNWKQDLTTDEVEDIQFMSFNNGNSRRNVGKETTGVNSIYTGNSLANDMFMDYMPVDASNGQPLDPTQFAYEFSRYGDGYNNYVSKTRHILVIHAEWMSKRKVAEVSFIDEQGMPQTMILDGEFKLDQKQKESGWEIKYFFINEAWEGIQIGKDLIKNVRPKANQHTSFNSLGKARLGFTGTIYNNRNANPVSILDTMKQHQMLYNVLMRKFEESINSDLGNIFTVNLNQIPNKGDWTLDKWLWYLREQKMAFVDTTIDKNNTGFTGVDLSQLNYMEKLVEMMTFLRNECWLMAGFSPNRLGLNNPSETATASNSALSQSYAQTAYDYRIHDDVKTRVLNLLLNEAKCVYNKEQTLTYFLDDMSRDIIEITEDFPWADLNVFVTDSSNDQKILETLRSPQMTQAAMQNGAGLIDVANMLSTDSIAELKEKLQEVQDAAEAFKQAQLKNEQDAIAQKAKQAQDLLDHNSQENQLDREKDIYIAQIKALGNDAMSTDTSDTEVIDNSAELALEASRLNYETLTKHKELISKDSERRDKKEIENRKLDIEEQRMRLEKSLAQKETAQQNAHHKDTMRIAKEKLAVDKIKARKANKSK